MIITVRGVEKCQQPGGLAEAWNLVPQVETKLTQDRHPAYSTAGKVCNHVIYFTKPPQNAFLNISHSARRSPALATPPPLPAEF